MFQLLFPFSWDCLCPVLTKQPVDNRPVLQSQVHNWASIHLSRLAVYSVATANSCDIMDLKSSFLSLLIVYSVATANSCDIMDLNSSFLSLLTVYSVATANSCDIMDLKSSFLSLLIVYSVATANSCDIMPLKPAKGSKLPQWGLGRTPADIDCCVF